MKTFKHGDLEFGFDMSDYEHLARMDAAFEKYRKLPGTVEAIEVEGIEDQVKVMKILFEGHAELLATASGDPDAMKKAIGDSKSLDLAAYAVREFVEFAHAQDAEMAKRWEALATKYSPKVAKPRPKK